MKKKILYGIAVLSIAAMAAFNFNVGSKEYGLSDVSLVNVEALADGESGGSCSGCALTWSNFCWMSEFDGCFGLKEVYY